MVVAIGQERRPVPHDGVEVLRSGCASVERLHRPPAAHDPRQFRVCVGIAADGSEGGTGIAGAGEVAAGVLEARHHRMDVRVLESGQQEPAGEVDDLGAGADQLPDLVVADGRYPAPGNGDRRGSAARRVQGGNRSAREDQICG